MRWVFLCSIALLVLSSTGALSQTETITPEFALERLLTAETVEEDWFAPSFLEAVPISRIASFRSRMIEGLGELREIRKRGDRWVAVYDKKLLPALVTLDEEGRFEQLRILGAIPNLAGLDEVMEELEGLPGTASLLISQNRQDVAALQADSVMAVGPTFKLAVLKALQDEIQLGKRKWKDTVALQEEWKSQPPGVLQNWPSGIHLTLETLAAMMISTSDNTAADALIHTLGREAVEDVLYGPANRPFLTTREAYELKAGWLFSARELCDFMETVAHQDLLAINPGVADPGRWGRVGFLGGSEPGVINFTTWLEDDDGNRTCVCLTQSDPEQALDEKALTRLYSGIIRSLEELVEESD